MEELLFRGHPEVVDADLADYFGSIPRPELLMPRAKMGGGLRPSDDAWLGGSYSMTESQSPQSPRLIRGSVELPSHQRRRNSAAFAAYIDATDYALGWSDQSVDVYARAMQRAEQALLLNPDQATAHYAKARLIMFKAKPNDGASANQVIAEAEATLRADPSYARAYWPMAVGDELLGHYEQSISHLEQAIRISPREPNLGIGTRKSAER